MNLFLRKRIISYFKEKRIPVAFDSAEKFKGADKLESLNLRNPTRADLDAALVVFERDRYSRITIYLG